MINVNHQATFIFSVAFSFILSMIKGEGEFCEKYGCITKDKDVHVGSILSISCSINENYIQNWTSTNISFSFKDSPLPSSLVHILNPFIAQLEISNATLENSGKYFCFVSSDGVKRYNIGITTMTVGYKPTPVKDFCCTSKNLESIECCWTSSVGDVHTERKLSLMEVTQKNTRQVFPCTENPGENRICKDITAFTFPPYNRYQSEFNVKLHEENILGKIDQIFNVDHYSLVLLNPPRHLKIVGRTATTIKLTWKIPEHFPTDLFILNISLVYQLQYTRTSTTNDRIWWVKYIQHSTTIYELIDLIPYTKHHIRLRCKLSTTNLWSDFVELPESQTKPDVPYLSPNTSSGAFEETVFKDKRNITIYWQRLLPIHYNGPDFYYAVTCQPKNLPSKRLVKELNTTTGSASFTDLETRIPYSFIVKSANSEGTSEAQTEIFIEDKIKVAPAPEDVVALFVDKGHFQIFWVYPEEIQQNLIGFTVFCYNLSELLVWEIAERDSRDKYFFVPEHLKCRFGVTANSVLFSSPMTTTSCPIMSTTDLLKLSTDQTNSDTMVVEWTMRCPSWEHFIERYEVIYCGVNGPGQPCNGSLEAILPEPSNNFILIEGLKENQIYRISVRAVSKTGHDFYGEPLFPTTVSFGPKGGNTSTLFWLIGLILGLTILSVIAFLGGRRLKQKMDRIRCIKVQLPEALARPTSMNVVGTNETRVKNKRKTSSFLSNGKNMTVKKKKKKKISPLENTVKRVYIDEHTNPANPGSMEIDTVKLRRVSGEFLNEAIPLMNPQATDGALMKTREDVSSDDGDQTLHACDSSQPSNKQRGSSPYFLKAYQILTGSMSNNGTSSDGIQQPLNSFDISSALQKTDTSRTGGHFLKTFSSYAPYKARYPPRKAAIKQPIFQELGTNDNTGRSEREGHPSHSPYIQKNQLEVLALYSSESPSLCPPYKQLHQLETQHIRNDHNYPPVFKDSNLKDNSVEKVSNRFSAVTFPPCPPYAQLHELETQNVDNKYKNPSVFQNSSPKSKSGKIFGNVYFSEMISPCPPSIQMHQLETQNVKVALCLYRLIFHFDMKYGHHEQQGYPDDNVGISSTTPQN
ncbi:cytokine receptor-like [Limulus polyphemus]|uniref:Cytokine receptor-like n=1 Tax=Limulus polyphemus TaxID=6850 RepID=A0ABM1SCT5_LIMPO|nr:cytokine receptor-like [Limulus polyphemus]